MGAPEGLLFGAPATGVGRGGIRRASNRVVPTLRGRSATGYLLSFDPSVPSLSESRAVGDCQEDLPPVDGGVSVRQDNPSRPGVPDCAIVPPRLVAVSAHDGRRRSRIPAVLPGAIAPGILRTHHEVSECGTDLRPCSADGCGLRWRRAHRQSRRDTLDRSRARVCYPAEPHSGGATSRAGTCSATAYTDS